MTCQLLIENPRLASSIHEIHLSTNDDRTYLCDSINWPPVSAFRNMTGLRKLVLSGRSPFKKKAKQPQPTTFSGPDLAALEFFAMDFPMLKRLCIGFIPTSNEFPQFTQFLNNHSTIEHLTLSYMATRSRSVQLARRLIEPNLLPNLKYLQCSPSDAISLLERGVNFLASLQELHVVHDGPLSADIVHIKELIRRIDDAGTPFSDLQNLTFPLNTRYGYDYPFDMCVDRLEILGVASPRVSHLRISLDCLSPLFLIPCAQNRCRCAPSNASIVLLDHFLRSVVLNFVASTGGMIGTTSEILMTPWAMFETGAAGNAKIPKNIPIVYFDGSSPDKP